MEQVEFVEQVMDDAMEDEFRAGHVDKALVKTKDLVGSHKNCTTPSNTEKTKMAWPSTFIQKIYG